MTSVTTLYSPRTIAQLQIRVVCTHQVRIPGASVHRTERLCINVSQVGASNELPESEELDALYDRFLIRRQVAQARGLTILRFRPVHPRTCDPDFAYVGFEASQNACSPGPRC